MNTISIKIIGTIAVIMLVLALQQLDLRYANKTGSNACNTATSACNENIEFLN